jgi:hypothetical protein
MAVARPGQVTPGAGRPKGSVNIYSKAAVKKLEELGFDPLVEMVRQMDDIDAYITKIKTNPNTSQVAIANLLATRQKCVDSLMRYGYARTPEMMEINIPIPKPMSITLTRREPLEVLTDQNQVPQITTV